LGTTVCELQWITYLFHDLQVFPPTLILVYCDNQAGIHIVANPIFHERTEHIEIDCHLVHDQYKFGFIFRLMSPASLSWRMFSPSSYRLLLSGLSYPRWA
ncbi:UNVERIFIED_CONTAM: hypothetical protein Slati_1127200, partial [Sesamum latifolium]